MDGLTPRKGGGVPFPSLDIPKRRSVLIELQKEPGKQFSRIVAERFLGLAAGAADVRKGCLKVKPVTNRPARKSNSPLTGPKVTSSNFLHMVAERDPPRTTHFANPSSCSLKTALGPCFWKRPASASRAASDLRFPVAHGEHAKDELRGHSVAKSAPLLKVNNF